MSNPWVSLQSIVFDARELLRNAESAHEDQTGHKTTVDEPDMSVYCVECDRTAYIFVKDGNIKLVNSYTKETVHELDWTQVEF